MKRGHRVIACLMAGILGLTGCVHHYERWDTDVTDGGSWPQDIEAGDHVKVRLADGALLDGEIRRIDSSRIRIDGTVVSRADVVWIEKREIRPIGVALVGLTVAALVGAVWVVIAMRNAEFGR